QPASSGPVTVAIHHPRSKVEAAEIRYDIWAEQDDVSIAAVIDYMPVLLGVDEPSLAAWAAFDEVLDQTAHLLPAAVLEARRQHPGMRLMATGQLVEELFTVVLEQKLPNSKRAPHGAG